MNFKEKNDNGMRSHYFDVSGAGQIRLSESAKWKCGKAEGFSLDVSWGKHGFSGGVIDREDAKALADMIYESLKNA